jgi:8-oxo-dGTP diphosphatase
MILATLCYIEHDNHTLMIHRNKKPNDMHKGKWDGLGGKFETGESPEDCVIREIREESGLEIHKPRLHGLLLFPNFFGNDWYVFVYTASEFSGDLINDSYEGTLEWIANDNLTSLNLWESDHIFFEWIKSGKFFSAKFIYQGDKLQSHEVTLYPQEV